MIKQEMSHINILPSPRLSSLTHRDNTTKNYPRHYYGAIHLVYNNVDQRKPALAKNSLWSVHMMVGVVIFIICDCGCCHTHNL